MRICIITVVAAGVGGMQRHTHDLVRGLVAVGHEVEVVAEADPSLESRLYGARWHSVATSGLVGDFAHPSWVEGSRLAFVAAHAERPFDVVHSEGSSALGLVLAGLHRQVPLVVQFHGNYLGLLKAAVRRATRSPLTAPREARYLAGLSRSHFTPGNLTGFRDCEAIVVSRQQAADTRISHTLDPRRLHVVPNGVDTELWHPLPRTPRARPLLVASGRLNREKGFDIAIKAMRSLDAELVVFGDGEERERLPELARRSGVDDRVRFAGARPQAEIALTVASADVFLFPTVREEAAPLVLPEAMSCGVAVVASRIGGIPEVIDRPGVNGILVKPGSVDALVAEVSRLLADDDGRRVIGEQARERILAEYTLEQMVERTVAVYRHATANARRSDGRTARGPGPGGHPARTTQRSSAQSVPLP